jgi:hypothetical protein
MTLDSIKAGGSALLASLLQGGGESTPTGLLAGLGVTAAALGLGAAYMLVLRQPSYASFQLNASFPTVPPNVLFDFLVEPANYYDPRINRKGYRPVVVEREAGKIAYVLEDDALGGLLHFSTPVVRRFYEHPDGRDSSTYVPPSSTHVSLYILVICLFIYYLFVCYIYLFAYQGRRGQAAQWVARADPGLLRSRGVCEDHLALCGHQHGRRRRRRRKW